MTIDTKHLFRIFEKAQRTHDHVFMLSRACVQHCSRAIKSIHANDLAQAKTELSRAQRLIGEIRTHALPDVSDIAFQEYTEAMLLYEIRRKQPLSSHRALHVPPAPYVTGILDLIGELRREMLEQLRKEQFNEAQYYFTVMEQLYEALLPFHFSDAVIPQFRRKQDVARHQLEQARSELFLAQYYRQRRK